MTGAQQQLVERAERSLRAARILLDENLPESSLNRTYYAVFYIAQAALAGRGESPKSHSGTHTRFSFHFVRSGLVPLEMGALLRDTFAARQKADYDTFSVFDAAAAADALADAEAFVAAVRPLVAPSDP